MIGETECRDGVKSTREMPSGKFNPDDDWRNSGMTSLYAIALQTRCPYNSRRRILSICVNTGWLLTPVGRVQASWFQR